MTRRPRNPSPNDPSYHPSSQPQPQQHPNALLPLPANRPRHPRQQRHLAHPTRPTQRGACSPSPLLSSPACLDDPSQSTQNSRRNQRTRIPFPSSSPLSPSSPRLPNPPPRLPPLSLFPARVPVLIPRTRRLQSLPPRRLNHLYHKFRRPPRQQSHLRMPTSHLHLPPLAPVLCSNPPLPPSPRPPLLVASQGWVPLQRQRQQQHPQSQNPPLSVEPSPGSHRSTPPSTVPARPSKAP